MDSTGVGLFERDGAHVLYLYTVHTDCTRNLTYYYLALVMNAQYVYDCVVVHSRPISLPQEIYIAYQFMWIVNCLRPRPPFLRSLIYIYIYNTRQLGISCLSEPGSIFSKAYLGVRSPLLDSTASKPSNQRQQSV